MRRWVAILLLFLASVYLGATSLDQCAEGVADDCAPVCHVFCADGCGTVPVPEAPVPPSPDPLPKTRFESERVEPPVSLDTEPEKDPPRV
jgi:hypothetical protein